MNASTGGGGGRSGDSSRRGVDTGSGGVAGDTVPIATNVGASGRGTGDVRWRGVGGPASVGAWGGEVTGTDGRRVGDDGNGVSMLVSSTAVGSACVRSFIFASCFLYRRLARQPLQYPVNYVTHKLQHSQADGHSPNRPHGQAHDEHQHVDAVGTDHADVDGVRGEMQPDGHDQRNAAVGEVGEP